MGRTEGRDADDFDIEDVAMPGVEIGRPGRSGRRSPNHRLRRASLAVAATVILAGAFAAGGLVGDPGPTSPPDQPPTGAACGTIGATSPSPAFRLAAAPDDAIGVRGLPGADQPRLGEGDPAWRLPNPEQSLTVAAARELRLILATGVCAAEIEIEAAPAVVGDDPDPGDRWSFLRTALDPASPEFAFLFPSEGDWGLRIVVRYWGAAGASERLVETFFRVRVGDGPFAIATEPPAAPNVTPAVSCGPIPNAAADVVVTLTTGGGDPVAGLDPGADPGLELPGVAVDLGDPVEIAVEGSGCATSWTIDVRTGDTILSIEGVPNVSNDPGRAAQNRWQLLLPEVFDEALLVVVLRLGPSVLVERLWQVSSLPFEIPPAFVVAPDGRRADAHPGCGLAISLASGYAGVDDCGSIGYDGGGPRFLVDAFETLSVEIPGWTIVAWRGECGQLSVDDGTEHTVQFEITGCELGGFDVSSSTGSPPVRFVLSPGDQVVRLQVSAVRDGDRFSLPYYLPVSAQ
ncbi:MAG TPA: hypothetical protein VF971_05180 [Candidatus Limnocylindrales bacterium]